MDLKKQFQCDPGSSVFAVLRIMLGFMVMWGFLDKMFGLGFPTESSMAYINGGSPTHDFLMYASGGTFGWLFEPMIDISAFTDVVLLIAMFGLGIALLFGIGRKIGCIGGAILFFMFYLSVLPISDNPILDYHLIYIVILAGVYLTDACSVFGFGSMWKETALVKKLPFLE